MALECIGSCTVSLVDVRARALVADVRVPGRTRWAIFDGASKRFYVNIADPAQIVVVDGADPTRLAGSFSVPAAGPHGLDLDPPTRRLFCACDGKTLMVIDAGAGAVASRHALAGVPDVVFLNSRAFRPNPARTRSASTPAATSSTPSCRGRTVPRYAGIQASPARPDLEPRGLGGEPGAIRLESSLRGGAIHGGPDDADGRGARGVLRTAEGGWARCALVETGPLDSAQADRHAGAALALA